MAVQKIDKKALEKLWQLQRDNELPLELKEGIDIFIPKGQIHRVIKGQTDLKLKIKK